MHNYLLVVFGWLLLFFAAIASLPGAAKPGMPVPEPPAGLGQLWRLVRRVGYAAGFLGWLVLLVGSLVVVGQQRDQRGARILATEPTATAVATVTQLRERRGRSAIIRSTLVTYRAGTEQVDQPLPRIGRYAVGQRLRVRYVADHPDMFVVAE